MTEENLDKLTINYLSEEQYQEAVTSGEVNENELYATPDVSTRAITNVVDNLTSTSITDALSANQGRVLKGLIDTKNIITAGISSNYTIETAGNNRIPIATEIAKVGDKFTISDGKIIVGSGISYVKVSANAMMTSATSGAKNMIINKSGTQVAISMESRTLTTSTNIAKAIGTTLVPVQEGDYFELYLYGAVGDLLLSPSIRTYITIEAI